VPTPTAAPPTAAPTPTAPPPTLAPSATPTMATPPALAAAVEAAMARAIERGVQPGGVVLIRHRGLTILHAAYGLSHTFDAIGKPAADPKSAETSTVYDLASLSKLYTTVCVMRLVESGRIGLDEPVASTLTEFGANGKGRVTLRQLLTHTAGLPDHVPLWELESTPEARLQRVLSSSLRTAPGAAFRYSDLGLITLGHLVQTVTGSPLDRVVADSITKPLRLDSTVYNPAPRLRPRIAPTEDESKVGRGMVWGEVHDENAWSLGGVAGHAGLFGTAEDVARFAQVFLDGGSAGSVRLLQPDTVAEMTRSQIEPLEWRALGFELNADYYMGRLASPATFGHTGFTGTSLVIDPRRDLIVVLLANRVHPTRNGPSQNPTRQAIANAALAAADAA
jgi:CubicO group peptidase (beta-lactamase class C family)